MHKSHSFVSKAAAARDLRSKGFEPVGLGDDTTYMRTLATGEKIVAFIRFVRGHGYWHYLWTGEKSAA